MKKIIVCFLLVALYGCGMSETKYEESSKSLLLGINQATVLCESVTEFYATIWSNAISKENSYFNANSVYYQKEFNEALPMAVKDMRESNTTLDSITVKIQSSIRELNDPPAKYKQIHEKLINVYGYYNEYVQMCKHPSGSLISFNAKRQNLSSEIYRLTSEIKVQFP